MLTLMATRKHGTRPAGSGPTRPMPAGPPSRRDPTNRPPTINHGAAVVLLAMIREARQVSPLTCDLPQEPDDAAESRRHDPLRVLRPGQHRGSAGPDVIEAMAAAPERAAHRTRGRRSRRGVLRHRAEPVPSLEAAAGGRTAPGCPCSSRSWLRGGRHRRTSACLLRPPVSVSLSQCSHTTEWRCGCPKSVAPSIQGRKRMTS